METDGIINRHDWLLGNSEMSGEFSGYLDRDNIPNSAIFGDRIGLNTFVKPQSEVFHSGTYTPRNATASWQYGPDASGDRMPKITFDAPHDFMMVAEFGAKINWGTISTSDNDKEQLCTMFRIAIDGVEITTSGPRIMYNLADSVYIVGALPVSAGRHVLTSEVIVARRHFTSSQEEFSRNETGYEVGIVDRVLLMDEKRR